MPGIDTGIDTLGMEMRYRKVSMPGKGIEIGYRKVSIPNLGFDISFFSAFG